MAKIRDKLRSWHATQLAEAEAAARAGAGVSFPFQVPKDAYLHALFRLMYGTCKTRGYKAIVKLFPHEVADLEPALQWLLCQVSGVWWWCRQPARGRLATQRAGVPLPPPPPAAGHERFHWLGDALRDAAVAVHSRAGAV